MLLRRNLSIKSIAIDYCKNIDQGYRIASNIAITAILLY